MENNRILYLNNFWITFLFLYYLFLFGIGFIIAIIAIAPNLFKFLCTLPIECSIFSQALLGSIGIALNGSSISYIRKLYKLCFAKRLESEQGNYKEKLGSFIYFLTRPLFAIGFSIIVVLGINTGLIVSSDPKLSLSNGFIYECMFISFFTGFLTGNFIKMLESYGKNLTSKVLK